MATDVASYREYVTARLQPLRRTAYLLCGNWHTADDLVSVALTKLFRHWQRVSRMDSPDAYVRKVILNAWLDERRRPWRRERPMDELPDRMVAEPDAAQRMALLQQLEGLPPRRRAVLVLRYFCDLSVDETAEVLGCTSGTVKSQTARALETLRVRLSGAITAEGELVWN